MYEKNKLSSRMKEEEEDTHRCDVAPDIKLLTVWGDDRCVSNE